MSFLLLSPPVAAPSRCPGRETRRVQVPLPRWHPLLDTFTSSASKSRARRVLSSQIRPCARVALSEPSAG
jgi:hypothetical protein